MFHMGAGFNLASKQYCLGSLYVTVLRVATAWTLKPIPIPGAMLSSDGTLSKPVPHLIRNVSAGIAKIYQGL